MEHDDPRPETFGALLVLVQHLTRRIDAALEGMDLTSRQWLLLALLDRWFAREPPTLSEAAARYGASRQNVKAIALGLERRGWVRLEPDPRDGRATRIRLTERIAAFQEPEAAARGEQLLANAFVGLDPDDVHALRTLLRRMVAGLEASGD